MNPPVVRHPCNRNGRDFVVGDIHGEFARLEESLGRLNFTPARDRLFSVGDLIDRGPDSPAALDWLTRPWFHAVLGNHEAMLLEGAGNHDGLSDWLDLNGGSWWRRLEPARTKDFVAAFGALPLAREVETPRGLIGIVHADVPAEMSWNEFVHALEAGDAEARHHALWSRTRLRARLAAPVTGVLRVYCGHTPLAAPADIGNVRCVDTGACFGGKLTVERFG